MRVINRPLYRAVHVLYLLLILLSLAPLFVIGDASLQCHSMLSVLFCYAWIALVIDIPLNVWTPLPSKTIALNAIHHIVRIAIIYVGMVTASPQYIPSIFAYAMNCVVLYVKHGFYCDFTKRREYDWLSDAVLFLSCFTRIWLYLRLLFFSAAPPSLSPSSSLPQWLSFFLVFDSLYVGYHISKYCSNASNDSLGVHENDIERDDDAVAKAPSL